LSAPPLRAVIGFGANLGERLVAMRAAARALSRVASVEKTSRVYATAPVGGPPQPEYLNAAALAGYEGAPGDLLDALLAIEADLGRVRAEKDGPRTIDLDVHPRLHERAFAMVPLLELVPGARDPRTGARYVAPPGDVRDTGDVL
jgi:2-amino-4-hydroxy-6-hydroxymethyldihydropteridine diphosphokinase